MCKFLTSLLLSCLFSLSAHALETVKGAQKDVEAFKKEMSAKLEVAETRLNELKNQAQAKGSETKSKAVRDYEMTRDNLKAELAQLQESSQSNWQKLKNNISQSVDALNTRIQKSLKE